MYWSVVSIEKDTIKIIGTIICKTSIDKNILNQDLKTQDVELFTKEINAKGLNNINILIITYRSEYETARFNNPTDIILLTKPLRVKMFNMESFKYIVVFISCIKLDKHIFLSKTFSPISLIESEKMRICLQYFPQWKESNS